MKSVGEVMAIGRNFTEALQKAIRMVENMEMVLSGFENKNKWKLENLDLGNKIKST